MMASLASANGTRHPAAAQSSPPPSYSASSSGQKMSDDTGKEHGRSIPRTPQMIVKVRDCPSSHMPIELCYQCFGDPNDGLPPVLLICGLNMQLCAWDEEFCETLVRAGFYVIRYDNRDMGHSTKIEHRGRVKVSLLLLPSGAATWLGERLPYNVEEMAADAWALLDALNIPCAHLFGISMGGMIAQTAALLAPERTISLTSVMSSTNAPDLPQPQLWVKLWMLRKPPRNCTVEELLEFRVNSLRRLLRSALPPDGEYLKKRYLLSLRRSTYSSGLVRHAAAIRRAGGRDTMLQRLCVPALVVHGAQDVVVPPMHGYRTATMLPYARMLVLKSMGHYFHPAFFSTIIEAFADMAASTDPARRGLGSHLTSASSMPLVGAVESANSEDGNASAAAAWRCGGGSVTSSRSSGHINGDADALHAGAARPLSSGVLDGSGARDGSRSAKTAGEGDSSVKEGAGEEGEAAPVDPKTVMMASMGAFIHPVVADASSPVGMAACRSVMAAVPGGSSNPGVPEAVIVENMFLRTPHAVPSTPTPTVVRRPSPQATSPTSMGTHTGAMPADLMRHSSGNSSTSSVLSSTSAMGGPLPGKVYASPLATEEKKQRVMDSATTATTLPRPLLMDGAAPYIPCSESRWHEVAPFPQRCTIAGKKGEGAGKADAAAGPSSSTSLPRANALFHPVVVGVPVSEYVATNPVNRETGGLVIAASAAAAAAEAVDANKAGGAPPQTQLQKGGSDAATTMLGLSSTRASEVKSMHHSDSPNVTSPISTTAVKNASLSELLKIGKLLQAESPLTLGGSDRREADEDKGYCSGGSPASRSSSQERHENESFLQTQAPEEVVEATTLPSL